MDSGSSSDNDGDCVSFKIVVMGDSSVGKTALIQSFCKAYGASARGEGASVAGGNFDTNGRWCGYYKPTMGVDFYRARVQLPSTFASADSCGGCVDLHIWDVGGEQKDGSMLACYVHDSDAVLLVYDVTNPSSLKGLEEWHTAMLRALPGKRTAAGEPGDPTDGRSTCSGTSNGPTLTPNAASPLSAYTRESTIGAFDSNGIAIPTPPPPSSISVGKGSAGASPGSAAVHTALSSLLSTPQRGSNRRNGGRGQLPSSPAPVVALVGTKTDASLDRHAVPVATHKQFAEDRSLSDSFRVSSRSGDRVPAVFLKITADLLGHKVRPADLEAFGFAEACLDSTAAERLTRPLMHSDGTMPRAGPNNDLFRKPDDCVIM